MAKAILDLSGRGGLCEKFYGDIDQVTPAPHLRYLLEENQLAGGVFNPFLRDGYLSPASNVYHDITLDQTLNAVIGSSLYDPINDDYYVAERGGQIFKGDGLDDTSLARQKNISTTGAVIHDLEEYQINGTRKLFYVYRSKTAAVDKSMTTRFSASTDSFSIPGRVNPSGSVEPTLLASGRTHNGSSGASISLSFTVPSGSNKVLVVVTATYNKGAATNCTATWDGNAMTQRVNGSGGNVGTAFAYAIFTYTNPSATTGNISITWDAAVTGKIIHAFVVDNANQASPFSSGSSNSGTSESSVTSTATITADYQLPFASVFSDSASHTTGSGQTEVLNTQNSNGNDSLSYFSMDTTRLRVGIASLPFASDDDSWLTSTVSGAFIQATTSPYNFMRVADNGYAYLFSDNKVHKIDGTTLGGTNGTVSESILLFPSHFRLTDGLDHRGNIYMVIHQSTVDITSATQTNYAVPCGVYIWDRRTTQVNMSDYIPVIGVRVIKKIFVAPNGRIRLICVASDGTTQIRQFNGSEFQVVRTLGIGAAPQFPDALAVAGQKSMWLAPNGSFYCIETSGDTDRLAAIGQIRAPQAETTSGYAENITAGAVLFGAGSLTGTAGYRNDRQGITLSYSTGTPVVKKFFPFDKSQIDSTDQTAHRGDIYSGVKPLPFMSTVRDITVFMAKGTATGSTVQATLKIYFNGSSTPWASKTVTRDDIAKGYKNIPVDMHYINAIQIEVEYATGVAFSDTYDFHPYYAEIIHESTNTLNKMPEITTQRLKRK